MKNASTLPEGALRAHIHSLCRVHKITWRKIPRIQLLSSKSTLIEREIWAPQVTSALMYAVALHEIGHLVTERTHGVLLNEAAVWLWVRDCALVWSPTLDALVAYCLTTCAAKEEALKPFTNWVEGLA